MSQINPINTLRDIQVGYSVMKGEEDMEKGNLETHNHCLPMSLLFSVQPGT